MGIVRRRWRRRRRLRLCLRWRTSLLGDEGGGARHGTDRGLLGGEWFRIRWALACAGGSARGGGSGYFVGTNCTVGRSYMFDSPHRPISYCWRATGIVLSSRLPMSIDGPGLVI
jgi:hypothetical protein